MTRAGDRLLVTGATGMIGGYVVDALVERGARLTAMVRPTSDVAGLIGRPGIDVIEGDFDDPASLAAALRGIERAFLVTNSSERTEAQQLAFVAAARAAGVARPVKLSQLHAADDSPVRFLRYHAAVEAAIEASGIPHTIIRPNLILQAFLALAPVIRAGVLPIPIGPTARVSVVDARDIASVAVAALTEPGHAGQTYDVTGPEALTHGDIAEGLSQATDHEVRFVPVPTETFVDSVRQTGMPAWQADGLAEDYAHYDRGEAAVVSPDVERVTGRPARSLREFVTDYAAVFRAEP